MKNIVYYLFVYIYLKMSSPYSQVNGLDYNKKVFILFLIDPERLGLKSGRITWHMIKVKSGLRRLELLIRRS